MKLHCLMLLISFNNDVPYGPGVIRVRPLCFLAGCCKRQLNRVSGFSLFFFGVSGAAIILFLCFGLLVPGAIDCLETLVFQMTYCMSSGTLNPTHWLSAVTKKA